jgi:hypothetical protein
MSEALKAALTELIDERLKELGLVEEEAAPAPEPAAKPVKPAKGKPAKEPTVTRDDVVGKLTRVVNELGKDEAKKLLKKYKCPQLKDLPEDSLLKFANDCDHLLNEAAKGGGEGEDSDLFGE